MVIKSSGDCNNINKIRSKSLTKRQKKKKDSLHNDKSQISRKIKNRKIHTHTTGL